MATDLAALGEVALIRRLTEGFPLAEDVVQGVGDDCAVLDVDGPEVVLLSADSLVEGVHFDARLSPMPHIGFKAISAAVSDIYAMNGRPTVATVSCSVSSRYTVEHLDELYQGIRAACDYYGLSLVGGDTTGSLRDLFLSVTVLGTALRESVVYRTGAQSGDVLCLSADVGAAYAGLLLLQREQHVLVANPDAEVQLDGYPHALGRQLRPVPSREVVSAWAAAGVQPTALIDVSDGLASELHHLARASQVGFRVVQAELPIHDETHAIAQLMNLPVSTLALYGGEDYVLLYTLAQPDFNRFQDSPFCHPIGFVTDTAGAVRLFQPDGSEADIAAGWFDHFNTKPTNR
ncbi:MAG: thiamine-phosphate kinase [Bacteroidia bacterium]|nr:thiamine-phosphate kinase [Bacteroidia bacterium]